MPAKPIIWNEDERRLLVAEAARLIAAGEKTAKTPALVQAMQLLPAERRRTAGGIMSTVGKWFTPALDAELARLKRKRTAHSTRRADGAPKVRWNLLEQRLVAQAVAAIKHTNPKATWLQSVLEAQEALPPERRRKPHTTSDMPWLRSGVERELQLLRESEKALADDAVAFVQEHGFDLGPKANGHDTTAPHGASEPAPTPTHAEPVAAPQIASIGSDLSVTLAGVRSALVDALASIFREALVKAVGGLAAPGESMGAVVSTEPAPRHDPRPTSNGAAPAKARPAVLVAGLKGAQKGVIEAEFGHILNLRFYGADESKEQLRAMTSTAEHSIAVTDFLSHSHTDSMKARSTHYMPTGGGMNTLRDTLRQLVPVAH